MRFRPARGSRPFFSYLPSFLSRWAASFCDVRFVLSLPCGKAEASSKCERRYTSLPAPHFWLWSGPLSFLGCTSLGGPPRAPCNMRSEEHTSELQSRLHLVCRLLLEKKHYTKRL